MIAVESLRKEYSGIRALDGISFSVSAGTVLGIVGPNGSGKTTLFDIIAGAALPTSGSVSLAGERIDGLPPHTVAARGVSRARQATRLFDRMTALENVVAGTYARATDGFFHTLLYPVSSRRERRSLEASARELLESMGLAHALANYPRGLTEGERRRVILARAMVAEPKALLLDEPDAGLDDAESDIMRRSISSFARTHSSAVLIAERDLTPCLTICDRALVLHAGRRVAEGPPAALQRDPDVLDTYLGLEWRQ